MVGIFARGQFHAPAGPMSCRPPSFARPASKNSPVSSDGTEPNRHLRCNFRLSCEQQRSSLLTFSPSPTPKLEGTSHELHRLSPSFSLEVSIRQDYPPPVAVATAVEPAVAGTTRGAADAFPGSHRLSHRQRHPAAAGDVQRKRGASLLPGGHRHGCWKDPP